MAWGGLGGLLVQYSIAFRLSVATSMLGVGNLLAVTHLGNRPHVHGSACLQTLVKMAGKVASCFAEVFYTRSVFTAHGNAPWAEPAWP